MPVYLFFAALLFCLAMIFLWTWWSGGPYTPVPRSILRSLFMQLEARGGETLVDLGCGDGRVLRLAAESYGLLCIGYELNPIAWLAAWLTCNLSSRRKSISLHLGDLFQADLSEVDIVFVHLLPHGLKKLAGKLQRELPRGAQVVSYGAQLPELHFERTLHLLPVHPLFPAEAYLYRN